jgi:hypothetical protein
MRFHDSSSCGRCCFETRSLLQRSSSMFETSQVRNGHAISVRSLLLWLWNRTRRRLSFQRGDSALHAAPSSSSKPSSRRRHASVHAFIDSLTHSSLSLPYSSHKRSHAPLSKLGLATNHNSVQFKLYSFEYNESYSGQRLWLDAWR